MKKTFIVISIVFFFLPTAWAQDRAGRMGMVLAKLEKEKAMEAGFRQAQEKQAVQTAFQDEYGPQESNLRELLRYWHPYLEVETKYEDNIYLTPFRKSDIVNTYTTGVKFTSLSEDNNLQLDTGAKFISYYHNWRNNTQNPFVSMLWNKKYGRNYIKLDERFKYDSTATSTIIADTAGFSGYQQNNVDLRVGREMNHFAIEPGYVRNDYFYRKDNKKDSDYNETIWIFTGYYKFAPKTNLLFEYNHGIVIYPLKPVDVKDSKYDQFWFGLTGDITSKITGFMKMGYQFRKFSNRQYLEKPIVGFDLHYQFKERTAFLLKLKKITNQASYFNQNYVEVNRLDLGAIHKFAFNSKLSFTFDSFYEYDNYPQPDDITAKRQLNNLFGIKTALKYDLQRWFSVKLGYEWKENDSNISLNDYVDHIISAKLTGSF